MNTDELVKEIYKIDNADDAMKVYHAFKLRYGQLKEIMTQDFKVGDKIAWSHNGIAYTGTVRKINKKTLSAMALTPTSGSWKIGITCCEKV